MVYYTIYNGNNKEFYDYAILAEGQNREEKKKDIANKVFTGLLEHIIKN